MLPTIICTAFIHCAGVLIGFDRAFYFVTEGTDAAMLIVRVIEGQLGRDVFVEFFTGGEVNDTALGKHTSMQTFVKLATYVCLRILSIT